MSKPETIRFIVILFCTAVAFFVVDFGVKWGRNRIQDQNVQRITVGMPEGEAARRLGVPPYEFTEGAKHISVWNHESVFDMLFVQSTVSTGWRINIESGKVVSVDTSLIIR